MGPKSAVEDLDFQGECNRITLFGLQHRKKYTVFK